MAEISRAQPEAPVQSNFESLPCTNLLPTILTILSARYGVEITTEESNENTVRTLRPVTANA